MFQAYHIRLAPWEAFYIKYAVRCRLTLVRRVSRAAGVCFSQTRPLAY
jgi:hypothetical protein